MKKKKGKIGKKVGQVKVASAGLEGFMGVDLIANELADGREDDMSSLATRFATRMHKKAASSQEETTPGFEVPNHKHLKQSGLHEKV